MVARQVLNTLPRQIEGFNQVLGCFQLVDFVLAVVTELRVMHDYVGDTQLCGIAEVFACQLIMWKSDSEFHG